MRVFLAVVLFLLVAPMPTLGASISSLSNVDIGGTLYNISFLDNDGSTTNTFNSIYDPNNDGNLDDNLFGMDFSTWFDLPTSSGFANSALTSIFLAMGSDDLGALAVGDRMILPFEFETFHSEYNLLYDDLAAVGADTIDSSRLLDFNALQDTYAWVGIEMVVIPEPSSAALLLTGGLALVAVAKKRSGRGTRCQHGQ